MLQHEWLLSFTTIGATIGYIYQKYKVNLNQQIEIDHLKQYTIRLTSENNELKKKQKVSGDVLDVLSDLKRGGAVLRVERINQDDIFYHNGSQYR